MVTTDPLDLRVPYRIIPTDLPGVFISPPPPPDFDPNTASRQSLIRNGFLWRRPEAGDDPALRAAWDRVFSRHWRAEDRVVPEFEPKTGRTHKLRNLRRTENGANLSNTWAGAVIPGTWSSVFGSWCIPKVISPTGANFGWSSSWVGLDGYAPSTDVVQAGVAQDIDQGDSSSYYAWYEWAGGCDPDKYPYINPVSIPNFKVTAGQTVSCSVQSVANYTAAQIYFANNDTGQHFSITLLPPEGVSFNGSSAEWIMEAPGDNPNTLPLFTPVEFTTAWCCGGSSPAGNPAATNSLLLDIGITGPEGQEVLFTSTTASVGSVTIRYQFGYIAP
jgi:Peptidase A4 family